ncbi:MULTISPECIES: response regulator [unclassified Oceanispirochaeta]|uniref:response regulator transcription factor n=1 Tax=unclassified Oceanispirochaeta TaxID=2635722 RepID=UPI000E092413|nr:MULTISPECIES: response regulator [unclassified Oceanispirochaeta]MBF9016737.1 response regulator [Oceanispirochaeta sp. M2]NPD72007.1 response regulator [Oceanispirochaeta sp. M1]RDG32451.1 response regulator [Oceanispirochaeta sp. M1]
MLKVVLADDEYFILHELAGLIDWSEYNCEIVGLASNGIEAQKMVLQESADLLISDIKMPGMDGLTLIDSLSQVRNMNYILISGYSDFEYALKAIKFQVADYLLKPLDKNDLQNALLKLQTEDLSSSKSEDESIQVRLRNDPYLKHAYEYIENHYKNAFSLEDMANSLNISPSYLSKLFVRKVDMRFKEFVNLYRIRVSQQILSSTNKTIEEVSLLAGYSDYKYFTRVFKKLSFMTPAQYRKEGENFINNRDKTF